MDVDTRSSVGAWDDHYADLKRREPYGDDHTYRLAAEWVAECVTVADWGCGKGWLARFVPGGYVGIDGSCSPFADVVADLATYDGVTEGIVCRHVLEHEYRWPQLFDNLLTRFTKRAVIVLFTPLSLETHVLMNEPGYRGVPVIGFRLDDLTGRIPDDVKWSVETRTHTYSAYGVETLIRLER